MHVTTFFEFAKRRATIIKVVKTLNSCCVDYRCFGVVIWTFHKLASILGNVRLETLLFVGAMGVNNVEGGSTSN